MCCTPFNNQISLAFSQLQQRDQYKKYHVYMSDTATQQLKNECRWSSDVALPDYNKHECIFLNFVSFMHAHHFLLISQFQKFTLSIYGWKWRADQSNGSSEPITTWGRGAFHGHTMTGSPAMFPGQPSARQQYWLFSFKTQLWKMVSA